MKYIEPLEITNYIARYGSYAKFVLHFRYPALIIVRCEDCLNESEVTIQPTAQELRDIAAWCTDAADNLEADE